MKLLATLCLAFIWLAGCGQDYFPLKGDARWLYELTIVPRGDNIPSTAKSVRVNISKKAVITQGGQEYKATAQLHQNGFAYFYQFLKAPKEGMHDGIYRVAVWQDRLYYQPEPMLVIPKNPKVGDEWQRGDRTFLMVQRYPLDAGGRAIVGLTMNYKVEKLNATVTTKAGTFQNCVYVVGRAKTNFRASRGVGNVDVEVIEENWFAEGVGLVKMERTESSSTEVFGTQSLIMELEEWS